MFNTLLLQGAFLLTYMRGLCEPMCEVLFLYILQDIEDMIPYHLYGGNVQAFVGGVYATQGRTKRYHVEVGVAFGKQSTLKTSVNATHDGLFTKQFLV